MGFPWDKSHEECMKNPMKMPNKWDMKCLFQKIHENAFKFYGVMKCNLMEFSGFGENTP